MTQGFDATKRNTGDMPNTAATVPKCAAKTMLVPPSDDKQHPGFDATKRNAGDVPNTAATVPRCAAKATLVPSNKLNPTLVIVVLSRLLRWTGGDWSTHGR